MTQRRRSEVPSWAGRCFKICGCCSMVSSPCCSSCPAHNHPGPDQTRSSRTRCTDPGKHPQEHLGSCHPTPAGIESLAWACGIRMASACCPIFPLLGMGQGWRHPGCLMQLLSWRESLLLFPKPQPTSQLKPEKQNRSTGQGMTLICRAGTRGHGCFPVCLERLSFLPALSRK